MNTRIVGRASRVLVGGLAGALVLVGCSGSSGDAESSESTAEFNDADVTFAQLMIPHHEQAVEMAELAASRAQDARVLDLADRVSAAQDPEIEQMSGWLQEWGQDLPEDMGGMDHGSDMGGMMSEDQMAALEAASGPGFDLMWLQMMTGHHAGAIAMAQTEIDDGQNADAIDLAGAIIAAQQAEIDEMDALLVELG